MNYNLKLVFCLLSLSGLLSSCKVKHETKVTYKKSVYIPQTNNKKEKCEYNDSTSNFNFYHKYESENIAVFWDKSFGKNPIVYKDSTRRFNPEEFLKEGERFYNYYIDSLEFVDKGKSFTDKYKMLLYMHNDDHSTAYGWGKDKVGIMWFRPMRIQKAPYCTLAHEMGHSFQYMVGADGSWGFSSNPEGSKGQPFIEMTSQWMLWQVYPEWIDYETFHLKSYAKKTHYALMHETNRYHVPQIMEYWSNKHGKNIIARIWKEAKKGEGPVEAYMRITNTNQEAFNDEVYESASRFVTWDLPRISKVCAKYANKYYSVLLDTIAPKTYRISKENCPQNYGYNAIRLKVPTESNKVELIFEGIAGDKNYNKCETDKAGWRYGFVAMTESGKRIYSKINIGTNGKNNPVLFNVPDNTKFLWLVVTGAPTKHKEHIHDDINENDEEWPYMFSIKGTDIAQ